MAADLNEVTDKAQKKEEKRINRKAKWEQTKVNIQDYLDTHVAKHKVEAKNKELDKKEKKAAQDYGTAKAQANAIPDPEERKAALQKADDDYQKAKDEIAASREANTVDSVKEGIKTKREEPKEEPKEEPGPRSNDGFEITDDDKSNGDNDNKGDKPQTGGLKESDGKNNTEQDKKARAKQDIYNGVAVAALRKRLGVDGKDPSGVSGALRNQADLLMNQAADEEKNSQQNFQIANRNYRSEADKNAAAQGAAENAQKVANMGNASAGAAALERGVATSDYNTHMERSDNQRKEGVTNQREMYGAAQVAESKRGEANAQDYEYQQMSADNDRAERLSLGNGEEDEEETDSSTSNNPDGSGEPSNNTDGEPLPASAPEDTSKNTSTPSNWQDVINYLTYGNDPTSGWSSDKKDGGAARAWVEANHPDWKPITATQNQWNDESSQGLSTLQQILEKSEPEDFLQLWHSGSGRFDESGKQTNAGDAPGVTSKTFQEAQV